MDTEGGRYRPSNFQSYGGDRRLEIVSGKGFGESKVGVVRGSRSPDFPATRQVSCRTTTTTASSSKSWRGFNDPEAKRKKRIAKYNVYTIEGRVKTSFKSGIRWIKSKCSEFIHAF